MTDDQARYVYQTARCVRGTEARAIARWEAQGWEVVGQAMGKAQTTLHMRRLRPRSRWALIGAAAAVLAVLAIALTALVVLTGGVPSGSIGEPSPTADRSGQSTPRAEPEPDGDAIITTAMNPDFAAVLEADECSGRVRRFAENNAGRIIEFDGSVRDIAPNGDYDTRFDILLGPGDQGPRTTTGPSFKFENVSISDLGLTDQNVPDTIENGDRLRLVTEVIRYEPQQCTLFLDPVETSFR